MALVYAFGTLVDAQIFLFFIPFCGICRRNAIYLHNQIVQPFIIIYMENVSKNKSPEFDRLAFTVLAIEASARKMGIPPWEMRRRLEKVGLIKSLIQDCYDTLHTESREAVANDVVEALKNWEREE